MAAYEELRSRDVEWGSSRPIAEPSPAARRSVHHGLFIRRLESVASGPGRDAGFPSTRSFRSSTAFAALLPRRSAPAAARSAVLPTALPALWMAVSVRAAPVPS